MLRSLFVRLRAHLRRAATDREVDEELRFHLDRDVERRRALGDSPGEARFAARRAFGNVTLTAERAREAVRWHAMEQLGQDLRYAGRALRRSPVFAIVAVLSLGLGIGANTAIFGVIDALLLRPLPVPHPERLVRFRELNSPMRSSDEFTYIELQRMEREAPVFSALAATNIFDRSNVGITGGGGGVDPSRARVALVTGNYFSMLGIGAALGRMLTANDDRVLGAHAVVVISDAYWQRRLGRAGDVLERQLTLNGTTYAIIGVAPPGFTGDWLGRPTDIWVPFSMHQQVLIEVPAPLIKPNDSWLHLIGRLRPGVTLAEARAAVQVVHERLLTEWAGPTTADARRSIARRRMTLESAARGYSPQRHSWTTSLTILTIVVGLVLAIACANVASLLVARAAARQRELAVRLALGASAHRLAAQLLTESLLLALLGGVVGLILALWGSQALATTMASGPVVLFWAGSSWISFDVPLNGRALIFTASICLLTGVVFGLAPALRGTRVALAPTLTGRGAASHASPVRFGIGKTLVVAQVALSLIVLVTSGLFVRTLHNLQSQELGFERQRLLLVWTQPSATGRSPTQLRELWQRVQERVSSLPGVAVASMSNQGVLTGAMPLARPAGAAIRIEGRPPRPSEAPGFRTFVAPRYFETMGIPLLAGREFTELDTDARPRVAIINEAMARHYFGAENPVGQRVFFFGDSTPTEIIGVVGSLITGTPRGAGIPEHLSYFSYRDRESRRRIEIMMVAVRAAAGVTDPRALTSRVRDELRALDPSLPIIRIDTIDEQLDDVLSQDRLIAGLGTFFGVLALLLACLGLYGVVAYITERRTSEIGIRMAVGATRRAVLGMVLRDSLLLVLAGLAVGIPATVAATRLLASRLFGVGANDPATMAAATLLMTIVAAVAAYVPARRAARVDPLTALRCE